ncbi:hypothetical protein ACEWY4_013013 [Coilia grayii]|uniref:Uncharacterized protein n=1 Tax=Coilia grayii TaxID=363190 RepID=A0ABD1JV89_9TELE
MDALCNELGCPICLEILTSPILELPCCHNYCKKCVHRTLDAQSSSRQQFVCPVCCKVTNLRSKGIDGIKRNIFAENLVDKFRQEAKRIAEGLTRKDLCPQHEEENLYCLTDSQQICSTCKVFGTHSTHDIAKLEDVYKVRKESFAKELKNVMSKCGKHANIVEEMERNIQMLQFSKQYTKNFVKNVGDSLILEIQIRVSSLMKRIEAEGNMMSKQMQEGLEVLNARRLCEEMIEHDEQSRTPHEFLKKEAYLRARAEKLNMFAELSPEFRAYVSHGKYVEELLSGFDVKKQKGMRKLEKHSFLWKVVKVLKDWRSDIKHFDATAYRNLDLMLKQTTSLKPNPEEDSDDSLSWELDSSEDEDPKQIWLTVKREQECAESNT